MSEELDRLRAADRRYREAGAAYTKAAADYEAACMNHGPMDEVAVAFSAAYREQGEALSELVEAKKAVPTFEEMLAHPWSQPDVEGLVYKNVIDATVALPFKPGAGLSNDR